MKKIYWPVTVAAWFLVGLSASSHADVNVLEEGDWTISIGADNRTRIEERDYFARDEEAASVIYNRFRIRSEVSYSETAELFIELLDGQEWRLDDTPEAGQFDGLDLHQAYIHVKDIASLPVDIKIGRQKIYRGRKRILGAPIWANKIRSFDALVTTFRVGDLSTDLIAANRVIYTGNEFNESDRDELLYGVYSTWKTTETLESEFYFLGKSERNKPAANDTTIDKNRITAGIRFNGKSENDIAYDSEFAYQFGSEGDCDVKAYALALKLSRQFEDPWKTMPGLDFHIASGDDGADDNTLETFVPPYQSVHGGYGIIDLFRWQNMREIALSASFEPVDTLVLRPEAHIYWIDNAAAVWCRSNGKSVWSSEEEDGAQFAGTELSIVAKYSIQEHIKCEAGYAVFFTDSSFTDDVEDMVQFAYMQTMVTF